MPNNSDGDLPNLSLNKREKDLTCLNPTSKARALTDSTEPDSSKTIACLNLVPGIDKNGEKIIRAQGLNGHQFSMLGFRNEDLQAMLPHGGILIQKKYLLELRKCYKFKQLYFGAREGGDMGGVGPAWATARRTIPEGELSKLARQSYDKIEFLVIHLVAIGGGPGVLEVDDVKLERNP